MSIPLLMVIWYYLVTLYESHIRFSRSPPLGFKGYSLIEIGNRIQTACQLLNTVYPKKYAHGSCFAVLCCGYTLTDFPISTRLTSLALWQSNDCPSASKATLMNMDKYFMWIHYERLHNHNKAKHNQTVCIFLGIYCICSISYSWLILGGTQHLIVFCICIRWLHRNV